MKQHCQFNNVDQGIFHLKIIRVKNSCGVNFRGFVRSVNNGGRLQYGQAPGEFLAFSLL